MILGTLQFISKQNKYYIKVYTFPKYIFTLFNKLDVYELLQRNIF